MTKPQYKTQRQELEPPKSPGNTTTIPPLMTTLAAVVEVGVHITVVQLLSLSYLLQGPLFAAIWTVWILIFMFQPVFVLLALFEVPFLCT